MFNMFKVKKEVGDGSVRSRWMGLKEIQYLLFLIWVFIILFYKLGIEVYRGYMEQWVGVQI